MAVTSIPSTNASVQKFWDEKLFRETEKELFWKPYMGDGENNIIQVKRELQKKQGDKLEFILVPRLEGKFVLGSSNLSMEGREQKITEYGMELTLEEYKLAVRTKMGLDAKRPIYDLPATARELLVRNDAEQLDQLAFDAIFDSPTKLIGPNGHDTVATLVVTDLLSPIFLRQLYARLKTGFTAGNATGDAGRAINPLRPIKKGGQSFYELLIHPYSVVDMKSNGDYRQDVREAMARSADNPIFGGELAVIENIIIRSHENVPFYSTGGGAAGTLPYSKAVVMGCQALLWAWGKNPEVIRKIHGYNEEVGDCTKTQAKVQKPKFNSLDFGSVGVCLSTTNIG